MSVHRFTRDPASGRYLAVSAACQGCHGCGGRVSTVRLPLDSPEARVTLQLVDQRRLIVNSLVKPLLLLVLVVSGAELAGLPENAVIATAILGFCLGLGLCRPMSWDILRFSGDDLC